MFDSEEIRTLVAEIAELRDQLRVAEERRNAQYTDIMIAVSELKDAISAIGEEEELGHDEYEDLYEDARAFVIYEQKATTSLLQRRFKIGYGHAAKLMEQLEEEGVIEQSDGTNRPREVLEKEVPEGYLPGTDDGIYGEEELDECYHDVEIFARENGKISTAMIQRQFKVGYGRAARIMDQLHQNKVIEKWVGRSGPCKVLPNE